MKNNGVKKDQDQDVRISVLETNYKNFIKRFDSFMTNDFRHVEANLASIKKEIYSRPTWVMTGIITLLVSLIVFLLNK